MKSGSRFNAGPMLTFSPTLLAKLRQLICIKDCPEWMMTMESS